MDHSAHTMTGMDGDQGGMMMYFHVSDQATVLFKGWVTHNWQTMLGSCIAVCLIGALYEGLKVLRELLLNKYAIANLDHHHWNDKKRHIAVPTTDGDICVDQSPCRTRVSVGTQMCSISHLIQTLLHVIQVLVSYFLMLVFMTFNFYLCVSVILGAGCGYFVFSWKRFHVVDINEHCH